MLRFILIALGILVAGVADAHVGVSQDVAELSRRLVEAPGDVDLLLRRAAAYRELGRPESALADLGLAARRSPGRREIFLERGLTYAALGKAALAEADLGRFLDGGAPIAPALVARGKLREASKRWALARADYDAALKLDPTPELYLMRGRVDEAAGDLDRAAANYEEGLKVLSGSVTVRLALIRLETARGYHDRALALIDEVLATAPVKADWLLRRAEVHAAAGREDAAARDRFAALRDIEDRLERRPNDLGRLTRARALLALGRREEAIAELERIVESSPHLEDARSLLDQTRKTTGAKRSTP